MAWDCRPLTEDGALAPAVKYEALMAGPPGKSLNSLSLIRLFTCLLFGDLAVSGPVYSVQPKHKCDETRSGPWAQDTICMCPNREQKYKPAHVLDRRLGTGVPGGLGVWRLNHK